MTTEILNDFSAHRGAVWRQCKWLAAATVVLLACFASPLWQLVSFASHSQLFSCILLIPFISGYLIWSNKDDLNFDVVRPCWPGAVVGWLVAGSILARYWIGRRGGWNPDEQDYLALMTLAFVFCFWGLLLAFLGSRLLRQILFPVAFLLFLVPMPISWMDNIDIFFQYTSAAMSAGFCHLFREPVARDGLVLQLTDFALKVAPECSGIHSTFVLLLLSLLAGYLLLHRYWARAVLVAIVVPLAIVRNGFRVFVIGWLCVHRGHQMIDSPIHRKGGPLFFALSLIPFFLLLMYLRKQESNTSGASGVHTGGKAVP